MTDFGKFSKFEPPAEGQARDEWLVEQEDRIARRTSRVLKQIITQSTEQFFTSLTASGDMAAFDGIPVRWMAYVDEFLGDEFGGLYLSGGLTAWIDTGVGERLPDVMATRWVDVVNENAVAYAEQAKNRMKDVGVTAWNDIKQSVAKSIATGTSKENLASILEKNQSFSQYRADTIARTETVGAFNQGNWEGQDALGEFVPTYKYWIATLDARGRPTHQEQHLVVKLRTEPYQVNGEEVMFPHAPGTSAKNVVNCRCRYGTLYPGEPHPVTGEPMPAPEGWVDPFGEGSGVFKVPNFPSGLGKGFAPGKTEMRLKPQKFGGDKGDMFDATIEAEDKYRELNLTEKTMPSNEFEALKSYQGSGYREMNAVLRNTTGILDEMSLEQVENAKNQIADLDRLISKTPGLDEDTWLYRGRGQGGLREFADVQPGYTFDEVGYGSTSFAKKQGERFAGRLRDDQGVLFRIAAPKGQKGVVVSAARPGGATHEYEFLLPRGTAFRVVERIENEFGLEFVLEIIN